MPEQEMYEWIGLPRSCEVEDKAPSEPRPLNLPRELYASASLDDLTDVKSMKLLAIDFGQGNLKSNDIAKIQKLTFHKSTPEKSTRQKRHSAKIRGARNRGGAKFQRKVRYLVLGCSSKTSVD